MDSQLNNNNSNLRAASFSFYLSSAEENFVLNLAEPIENPPAFAFATSQETPYPISLGRTKTDVGEINVFGAERYFNMKLDDDSSPKLMDNISTKHGFKRGDKVDLHHTKPKSRPGTPSASSEASWNSQTALLPRMLRNPSLNKHKKVNGKSFFATLSCHGSCSDKKSVHIDKNVEHGGVLGKEVRKESVHIDHNSILLDGRKQSQTRSQAKDEFYCPSFERMKVGSNREEYFALPNLNSGVQNSTVKSNLAKQKTKEEVPRKSLEVFGSHMMKKGDIAMNLTRKLSMLTWDAIPESQSLPATSRSTGGIYEDNESDASSDLFEIENLSANGPPLFTRQASDGMSSCMTPTNRYEPSEASIEWSVVTASAADFSVNSDYDEKKLAANVKGSSVTTIARTAKANSIMDKEVQRSRPSGLLGCKSHKAVRVAETVYVTNEKAKSGLPQHEKLDASMPVGKLQAATMVKDFYFPGVQHV